MARRERILDPQAGPMVRFAADLRRLRRDAGTPTYRHMAARTHYAASTLSQAASGERLPSLDVALAYVQACGGDVEPWQQRWQALHDSIHRDAEQAMQPMVRRHDGAGAQKEQPNGHVGSAVQRVAARRGIAHLWDLGQRLPRRLFVNRSLPVLAVVVGGVAVVLMVNVIPGSTPQTGPRAEPSAAPQARTIRDGADPMQAGCADDAFTVTDARLTGPEGEIFGLVELRYAPACHAAWTRYRPAPRGPDPTMVTIAIRRPTPVGAATATFVVHAGGIWSDMQLFAGGCLQAEATVHSAAADRGSEATADHALASAQTPCTYEPATSPGK